MGKTESKQNLAGKRRRTEGLLVNIMLVIAFWCVGLTLGAFTLTPVGAQVLLELAADAPWVVAYSKEIAVLVMLLPPALLMGLLILAYLTNKTYRNQ